MDATNFQNILENLNKEQSQAVEATEGPVMVLAGPGTGKTQLLSARIANILYKGLSQPENILCLTYTEAGAVAMKRRLGNIIGSFTSSKVHISTFHSFCARVISENPEHFGYRFWQPISDLERIEIIHSIIDSLPLDNPLKKLKGNEYQFTSQLKSLFDIMKTEGFSVEDMQLSVDQYIESLPSREKYIYKKASGDNKKGDLKTKAIEDEMEKMSKLLAGVYAFPVYSEMLEQNSLYDFADMILWVIQAFKSNDTLLGRYQETYQYILVDEYQDTNGSQNEILSLLTSYDPESSNIFVVGDDDQSIYSFQGASMERVKDFYYKFKNNLQAFALNRNYRSRQEILDAATVLISSNLDRLINDVDIIADFTGLSKDLKSSSTQIKNREYSEKAIEVVAYHNPAHEAAGVVKEIKRHAAQGVHYGDMAILYRNHTQAEKIRQLLEWEKIPYNAKRTEDVLLHPLIQKINLLLKYINTEAEQVNMGEEDLFKILHFDFFQCSPRDIAVISLAIQKEKKGESFRSIISSNEKMLSLGLTNARQLAKVNSLLDSWMVGMFNQTLPGLLQKIMQESGLLHFLINSEQKTDLLETLTTYFQFVQAENDKRKSFDVKDLIRVVEKMKENYLRLNVEKSVFNENGINLITVHSSKGLEFKYVFLIQCNDSCWEKGSERSNVFTYPDNLLHSTKKAKDENYEELRRLFFVAVTRAKEHIQISYPIKKLSDSSEDQSTLMPSLFVNEIIEKYKPSKREVRLENSEITDFLLKTLIPVLPETSRLEKQFVDKALQNFTLNITKLNDIIDCPLAFYYKHILKIPQAKNAVSGYGTAIHEALQLFFNRMQNNPDKKFPSKDELVKYFYESMNKIKSQFTENEFKLRNEHGRLVLTDYYLQYSGTWAKVIACEVNVQTEVLGVPINGRLDKLEFDGKAANVVDYKTAKPDNPKELIPAGAKSEFGGKYWRQLVFYKILMDQGQPKGWHMQSGEIDFVEFDKNKSFKKEKRFVSEDEVKIVTEQIKTNYTKILAHDFYTGCEKEDCICKSI
ncbi:MAG: ATP-dependent helicase [Opitutaceae bacterium]|nr:ATP-dependent helicase [Cytophagales bacterium]